MRLEQYREPTADMDSDCGKYREPTADMDSDCGKADEDSHGIPEVLVPLRGEKRSSVYEKPTWMFWKKKRHLMTFLAFLGFIKACTLKVSVSMAVVAMTSTYNTTLANGTVRQVQDFDWNSKMQGVFLSSFFYGQVSSQLFGGWLGARLGGARLFGFGMGVTSLLTTVTPPIAYANFYLLLLIRALTGFFEGMAYPCTQEVLARWTPPQERSTTMGIIMSGIPIGTVLGLQTSGLIADYLGWEFIFYITGAVGILWCILWLTIVKDRPEYDPHISPEELKYIKDSIVITNESKQITHPWVKLITSMPVWAITVGIICENWGHVTLYTQLPTYLKDVYNFRLAKSGFIMSMPYIVMGIGMQGSGKLADWLQYKNILTTTQVRKIFGCGTFFVQAAVIVLSTVMESVTGFILSLILLLGIQSFSVAAIPANSLDLAPQHASVIFGLALTLGSTPGILSPSLSGFIVTDHSKEQWKIVFYIASGFYLFGGIFYGLFSSGELQPWATDGTGSTAEQPETDDHSTDKTDRIKTNGNDVI